ncbi:hypothetical protein BV898_14983 [Hypsibius exemplaris]|uniref:Uncharacterized protein n=1 Tax=Hypsibius exemplaris TaxID=2072580 RepID=A0A9X6NJD2_HYPEX|nr:hypothetical protein BV898_14983 [Hypsibius exemplaris]
MDVIRSNAEENKRDRGFFLAMAQGPSIWKLPVGEFGNTSQLSNVTATLYWSHSSNSIKAAAVDGRDRQVLVTGISAGVLAVDYEADELYWADVNKFLHRTLEYLIVPHTFEECGGCNEAP